MKADNAEEAIEEFLGLPNMEKEKGDWLIRLVYALCYANIIPKGLQRLEAGYEIGVQPQKV